jgi:hypothetical protein
MQVRIKNNMMKLESTLRPAGVIYHDYNHTYTREHDNVLYPSCSAVVGMIPKEYLIKWSTNENYYYMKNHWDISKTYNENEKNSLLLSARDAYKEKQNQSLKIGTRIHDLIERHIKGEDIIKKMQSPEEEYALTMFFEWEQKNVQEWLASELLVASHEIEVAGRLDAVAMLKGNISAIVDFKTSNEYCADYEIQTAGYWLCLKEMGYGTDQRIVLRLPKSFERKRYDKKNNRYFEEKNILEECSIFSDINEDIDIFKGFKKTYDWKKKNEK